MRVREQPWMRRVTQEIKTLILGHKDACKSRLVLSQAPWVCGARCDQTVLHNCVLWVGVLSSQTASSILLPRTPWPSGNKELAQNSKRGASFELAARNTVENFSTMTEVNSGVSTTRQRKVGGFLRENSSILGMSNCVVWAIFFSASSISLWNVSMSSFLTILVGNHADVKVNYKKLHDTAINCPDSAATNHGPTGPNHGPTTQNETNASAGCIGRINAEDSFKPVFLEGTSVYDESNSSSPWDLPVKTRLWTPPPPTSSSIRHRNPAASSFRTHLRRRCSGIVCGLFQWAV